eukprot:9469841-Pyramimonas_sp.AAC.1
MGRQSRAMGRHSRAMGRHSRGRFGLTHGHMFAFALQVLHHNRCFCHAGPRQETALKSYDMYFKTPQRQTTALSAPCPLPSQRTVVDNLISGKPFRLLSRSSSQMLPLASPGCSFFRRAWQARGVVPGVWKNNRWLRCEAFVTLGATTYC